MHERSNDDDPREDYDGSQKSEVTKLETERDFNDSFDEDDEKDSSQQTQLKLSDGDSKDGDNGDVKPTHSYIALIAMAILSIPSRKMILGDIYQYISDNFAYYRNKDKSWRNSIRHNLSLNECFIKAGRSENGKGNYWAIHPANLEDFMNGDFRRRRARRRVRRSSSALKLPSCAGSYIHGFAPFGSHSPFHPYRSSADDFRPFYPALSYLTPHCRKNFAVESIMSSYADPPTMCSLAQRMPYASAEKPGAAAGLATHYSNYAKTALPRDFATYGSSPSSAFANYLCGDTAAKYGSGTWQETLNRLQEQLHKATAS